RSDHLDRATCQSKRKRPDGALPRPVEHVVHRRDHEILFEPLVQYTHRPPFSPQRSYLERSISSTPYPVKISPVRSVGDGTQGLSLSPCVPAPSSKKPAAGAAGCRSCRRPFRSGCAARGARL